MSKISNKIIDLCKEKLISMKADILNRVRNNYKDFHARDRGGDETDLAIDSLAESEFLINQDRLRQQLLDIEVAQAKIEMGSYGICEETEEFIEVDRLLAIPWTRLSVEGAEMRESLSKRYAK